jgi:CRISPR system Cascade subunit CasA
MATFNLIHEPWLPCIGLNGEREELGLREILLRSRDIRELFDESPLVTVALHRLLLAILHRNFGPKNRDQWTWLWAGGTWNEAVLSRYFGSFADHFDLFHPAHPFYQVPEMPGAARQPVSVLTQELSRGNNTTLFDHSFEASPAALAPGSAARAVVATQAFSIGFGRSSPFYLSDSPLIRGLTILITGRSLFETLALNLLPYPGESPIPSKADDKPVWEHQKPTTPRKGGSLPAGYLDYLTWQSRRIHLYAEGKPPTVRFCQLQQNLKLAEGVLDPFKCYVKSKAEGYRPLGFKTDKALWRDSHALFQQVDDSSKRPDVFNYLARVDRSHSTQLHEDRPLSFSAFGLVTEIGRPASVTMWRHERLPLPLEYLDNKPLLDSLKRALNVCEDVAEALRVSARELAKFLLAPNCDQRDAPKPNPDEVNSLVNSIAIQRHYWPELEVPFKEFLVQLANNRTTDADGDPVYGLGALPRWIETVRAVGWRAMDETIRDLDSSGRSFKAATRARREFYRGFARANPAYSTMEMNDGPNH